MLHFLFSDYSSSYGFPSVVVSNGITLRSVLPSFSALLLVYVESTCALIDLNRVIQDPVGTVLL